MGKKFMGLGGTDHFWDRAKAWILNQITSAVTAKIAEVVANAPEDLDTLKEIADWISAHADDAAAMNTQITENKNNIAANSSSISAMNTAILANTEAISGKADKSHTHTKSEITDFDHTHDDRYYTESEVDAKLSEKSDIIPSNASASNKLVTQNDALIYYQSDSSSITNFDNAVPQTGKGAVQMFYLGSDITNAPTSSGGGFIVIAKQLSTTYISQLATQIGTNNTYTRSKSTNGWSSWQKLVTESDLNSKGVFKGYIEPNKKLTINMDPYSEVYGYVQVQGIASIPFRLHNAAKNASPSVFLKKSVTLSEETVYVEKSFGVTASIGSTGYVTITNTNGVWTITNTTTETESYWVGGGVNSVTLSDA